MIFPEITLTYRQIQRISFVITIKSDCGYRRKDQSNICRSKHSPLFILYMCCFWLTSHACVLTSSVSKWTFQCWYELALPITFDFLYNYITRHDRTKKKRVPQRRSVLLQKCQSYQSFLGYKIFQRISSLLSSNSLFI